MEELTQYLTRGTDLTLWVFAGLCAISFVGSVIAASLGLGGGLLVLATMATVLPPTVLIPLHGVVQFGSNAGRAVIMARHVLYAIMPAFLLGTLLGAAVGGLTFQALPVWALQLVLGLFVLWATWAPKFRSSRPGPAKFFGVGAVGAFTTMFVGGTGPLIAPFVSAACGERQQVVSTHAFLMSLQHGFKVVAFGLIGFAFGPYIPLLVGLLVFGFLGTLVGRQVLNRLPEPVFRRGLQVVLTILAGKLLYDSFTGFFA